MYAVRLAPRAVKELRDCPAGGQTDILAAVAALGANPRPPGSRKLAGALAGSHRIRVGTFRVLYDIDDGRREVFITKIGPRKSVYR